MIPKNPKKEKPKKSTNIWSEKKPPKSIDKHENDLRKINNAKWL